MKKIYVTLVLSCLFFFLGNAQQSILLNTGKRIAVTEIKIDTLNLIFYKTESGKIRVTDMEDVFSWKRNDSVEVIFYKPACTDVCFRIDQMRDYLHGQADGRTAKRTGATISGFVAGAASGLILPAYGLFILSPVVPAVNSGIFGAVNPKENHLDIPEKYAGNKHYIEGYKNSIKRKRVINSIIGGAFGLVSGIIAVSLIAQ